MARTFTLKGCVTVTDIMTFINGSTLVEVDYCRLVQYRSMYLCWREKETRRKVCIINRGTGRDGVRELNPKKNSMLDSAGCSFTLPLL